jgi:arginyl-tRNA synthetase
MDKDKFKEAIVSLLLHHLGKGIKSEDVEAVIEIPDEKMGDYAFPCFFLAKQLKKSPIIIASELSAKLDNQLSEAETPDKFIEKVQNVGPYLNFFVNKKDLVSGIIKLVNSEKESFGKAKTTGKTAMVEYFDANTHKAVHIGHVRNICMGEALCRILETSGNEVVRANYQGDIGPHVAKCIWGLRNLKDKIGSPPSTNKLRWLGDVYVKSNTSVEDNEKLESEVKQLLLKIYDGDKDLTKVWKDTRQWCLDEFEKMYEDFGVKYNEYYFESDMEFEARKIAKQLQKKKIAKESDGAIIVDLKKQKLGVFVLLTQDGTALYSVKDIALARAKMSKYSLDSSINLVGKEQELHFKQLFKTLELIGSKEKKFAQNSHHLIYGLVMLPTGKMSSRAGSVVFYDDLRTELIALATEEVKKRHKDWDEKKTDETAKKIAFAALKFSMINRDNEREVVFDWENAMKLEGETGPYLQYAYARISSIFRKYGNSIPDVSKIDCNTIASTPVEVKLAKQIADFPATVQAAADQLKPAIVSRYLLDLAQAFSSFYNDHPILKAEDDVKEARLVLCSSVKQVLENGLKILAIDVLDEM